MSDIEVESFVKSSKKVIVKVTRVKRLSIIVPDGEENHDEDILSIL